MSLDQQPMACPDWSQLVGQREAQLDDPPGWRKAMDHLDSCRHCRPRALAAEPTLLFRRLPTVSSTRGGHVAVDVEAMKRAVATLRRTGPLQRVTQDRGSQTLHRRLPAVAAGLLFVVLLGLTPGVGERETGTAAGTLSAEMQGAATVTETGVVTGFQTLSQAAGFTQELQPSTLTGSLIEDLELPNSRIYQMPGKEMALTMVVSPSLDV